MADVRNHNNRALPFGALLTKIFKHFRVKFSNQISQHIDGDFSKQTIKRGISVDSFEEEGEEESSHHAMEIEGHFEKIPPQTKETHEEPSAQDLQLQLQEGEMMQEEHPMQKGSSSQEGPLSWFLEYFGKLNAIMEVIKQHHEKQEKYIE